MKPVQNIHIYFKLGATFGQILLTAFRNGLNINRFHLVGKYTKYIPSHWRTSLHKLIAQLLSVGHSLGAQLIGFLSRAVMLGSNNSMKLRRITGLDPANPAFFFPSFFYQPLTHMDAEFVDIIHTDANVYGQPYSTGTADFWPNGGSNQPGCPAPNFIPFAFNGI